MQRDFRVETFVVGALATNCHIVTDAETEKAAVIDPGASSPELEDALDDRRVEWVILTHAHADHIGGTAAVTKKTGASVALHRDDVQLYGDPARNLSGMTGATSRMPDIDRQLRDGDEIAIGRSALTVHHTPGHTPGSITLAGGGVVFSGDTLFAGSIGRTDLPGGSHEDIVASLTRLVQDLDPSHPIYPGHGPQTTLNDERGINPYLPNF